jgi:hypothetical protein
MARYTLETFTLGIESIFWLHILLANDVFHSLEQPRQYGMVIWEIEIL